MKTLTSSQFCVLLLTVLYSTLCRKLSFLLFVLTILNMLCKNFANPWNDTQLLLWKRRYCYFENHVNKFMVLFLSSMLQLSSEFPSLYLSLDYIHKVYNKKDIFSNFSPRKENSNRLYSVINLTEYTRYLIAKINKEQLCFGIRLVFSCAH